MLPLLSMLMASTLSGSMVLVADLVGQSFPAFTAAALRFGIASCVLVPIALRRRVPENLPARDWGLLTVQAAAGTVGFMIFFIQGVQLAGPVNAGITAGMLPALIALAGFLLLRERIEAREQWAILSATVGLVALALAKDGNAAAPDIQARALGLVCLVLAYSGDAVFTILSKRLSRPVDATFVAASMTSLGFLLSLGPAVVETAVLGWPSPPASGWLALLWFATGPTIFSFLLWYWGVERSTAATAGVAIAAMPVSAVLLSWGILGSSVSAVQMMALALVLLGVALVLTQKRAVAAA